MRFLNYFSLFKLNTAELSMDLLSLAVVAGYFMITVLAAVFILMAIKTVKIINANRKNPQKVIIQVDTVKHIYTSESKK